jgi:hypothetical protein
VQRERRLQQLRGGFMRARLASCWNTASASPVSSASALK